MAKKKDGAMSLDDLLSAYGHEQDECIKLSVEALNQLWGGGMYLGYMYAMWGEQGSGKSTLAIQAAKSFLRKGLKVAWLDTEKALNDRQKESFKLKEFEDQGIFIHLQVSNYEDVEKCIEVLAESDVKLVVWDSETMTRPVTPKDLKVTDVRPGLKALQANHVINKMKDLFSHAGIASIPLFHARANISINGPSNPYAPATKQAGGYSALHVPDVITKVVAGQKVKGEEDQIIGSIVRLMCEKNKFTPPFQTIEKKLIYGRGIDPRIDLIDSALEAGIIVQSGAYFQMPWGENIRGRVELYNLNVEQLKKLKEAVS